MTKGHLIGDTFSEADRRWVADTLGAPLLAWAADVTQDEITAWVSSGRWLGDPHAQALDELAAEALRRRYQRLSDSLRPVETIEREVIGGLTEVRPGAELSFVSALRLEVAGPPPASSLETPTERALEAALWHFWPALLADERVHLRENSVPSEVLGPLASDVRLAPILKPGPGRSVLLAPGSGQSHYDPVDLAASLAGYGVERARQQGLWPRIDAVLDAALEALEHVYQLAAGEQVALPALIAFADIVVPEGWRFEIGDFRLRAATATDRHRGTVEAGLILETSLPTRLSTSTLDATWDWRTLPGRDNYIRARERAADRVVLAFALAYGTQAVPRAAWSHLVNPLTQGWMAEIHGGQIGVPLEVCAKRTAEVESWLGLLDATMTEQLEIPARRVVASMTERGDPRDALIDAVVAWDALVGATPETVLRVTTSLAVLVEDDIARRPALQRELKAIYGLRSKLVHGNSQPSEAAAHHAHSQALDVALESLRRILAERPGLAGLNSTQRSTRLLLGLTGLPAAGAEAAPDED